MYIVREGCSIFLEGKQRLVAGQEVPNKTSKEQIKFWKGVGSIVEGREEKETKKDENKETPIVGVGKKEDSKAGSTK